ncbi:MAG: hypothetical protein AB1696_26255 [Planctomycetota bacterium]
MLYHHVWIELVSAGMDRYEVTRPGLPHELRDPEMPPVERVRKALNYLDRIRNTTCGVMLHWILKDLYGVEALDARNIEQACALVEERGCDPAWQERVLREYSQMDCNVTVEYSGKPSCSPRILRAAEGMPVNLTSGKQSPQEILAGMDRTLGREVRSAADFRALIARHVRENLPPECRYVACWVPPFINHESANDAEVSRVIGEVRNGREPDSRELGRVSCFGVAGLIEELRKTPIRVIQLFVGAEVLPPHQAITQWSESLPGCVGRLAGQFEDFHFNLVSASDHFTQDMAILAKHVPNISVAGYWWHTLYPFYIRKAIETRLDMVPINKVAGFFSDAYHSEWCYPKLKLVKQILAEVLIERIQKGWYTLDAAQEIVNRWFYQNPKEIFRV